MADTTKIEWADSTFNGWMGCTRVGPGCDHCYAAVSTPVRTKGIGWGPGQPRTRTGPDNWAKPVKWNRDTFIQCANCGWRGSQEVCDSDERTLCTECRSDNVVDSRRRVFSASLSDWLDNDVPIEWLVDLLDLIRTTPNLDWLMLSKRIGLWTKRVAEARNVAAGKGMQPLVEWLGAWLRGTPPANVWLGITAVNQQEANRDVTKLLHVPAVVHFLSCEPLLGPIDIDEAADEAGDTGDNGIDWVIVGFESGKDARPGHTEWLRRMRDQCEAFDTAFMFKQWGEWAPYDRGMINSSQLASHGSLDTPMQKFGKKATGNMLDGRQHLQFPTPRKKP